MGPEGCGPMAGLFRLHGPAARSLWLENDSERGCADAWQIHSGPLLCPFVPLKEKGLSPVQASEGPSSVMRARSPLPILLPVFLPPGASQGQGAGKQLSSQPLRELLEERAIDGAAGNAPEGEGGLPFSAGPPWAGRWLSGGLIAGTSHAITKGTGHSIPVKWPDTRDIRWRATH